MRTPLTLLGMAAILALLSACQSAPQGTNAPRICTPRAQDAGYCYGSFTLEPGLTGI